MVRVPDQQGWKVSGSKSSIIGNLDKGDYTVATFSLSGGGAPSEEGVRQQRQQSVLLEIAYTDTMGQRLVVEKQVEVSSMGVVMPSELGAMPAMSGRFGPRQQTTSFWSVLKWPLMLAGLIALYFGYRHHKRKGKKR